MTTTTPPQMRAIALTGVGRVEMVEVATPRVQHPDDVLLRIEQVGLCGSDLHYFETGRIASRAATFPFVLGHECSATVIEIGSAVQRAAVGDLVAVDPAMSCHACDQCHAGRPHTCRHLRFLGCPGEAAGCLSEYLVMPETSLYPCSRRLTPQQACLCEPLSIALYAVRQSGLGPGADVAILGSGPIGLCVLLAARQAGARQVFMTDRVAERVAFAARAQANWSGNPDERDVVAAIQHQQPAGLDHVFECAGQQATLDQAVTLLKPGGTLSIVGIPREDHVSFHIDSLRRKEIILRNVRRQNHCVAPSIEAVATGAIPVDGLVTHRFAPAEAQPAFELVAGYRDGVIKAVIVFH